MKRVSCFIAIVIAILIVCLFFSKRIESTDLSNVKLDNIVLGETYKKENFSQYTISDSFEKKTNKIYFNELQLTTNDKHEIIQVKADIEDINLSINDNSNVKSIDNVINILGENYSSGWYDKEQGLKYISYIDRKNNKKAICVYSEYDREFVWIILKQYKTIL